VAVSAPAGFATAWPAVLHRRLDLHAGFEAVSLL
jgi:hypothetical protein